MRRVLGLKLDRLKGDWKSRWGFVVKKASGWEFQETSLAAALFYG